MWRDRAPPPTAALARDAEEARAQYWLRVDCAPANQPRSTGLRTSPSSYRAQLVLGAREQFMHHYNAITGCRPVTPRAA